MLWSTDVEAIVHVTRSESSSAPTLARLSSTVRRAIRPLGRTWTSCSHSFASSSRMSRGCAIAAGARGQRPRAATESGDRRVPDPRRLPRFAATIEQDLIMAPGGTRETATSSRNLPPPSSPFCGPRDRSLPTRDRRAALDLAERRVDPHPRAVPQAGRKIASGRGRAPARARPARSQRITRVILGPHGPNRGHGQAC